MPLPRWMRRKMVERRQVKHYIHRDGGSEATKAHIEQGYFRGLENMSAMLADRPFLLGDAPSLADFGMMAPMFRHFGEDPTPQELMRTHAPIVYEWVARMWRAKDRGTPQFLEEIPEDTKPMLQEICETHLQQLIANAEGYAAGQDLFAMNVQGCDYKGITVSRYRVWCLEELRRRFAELSQSDQQKVQSFLPYSQAEILWAEQLAAKSNFNTDNHLPFGKAINVYRDGTP